MWRQQLRQLGRRWALKQGTLPKMLSCKLCTLMDTNILDIGFTKWVNIAAAVLINLLVTNITFSDCNGNFLAILSYQLFSHSSKRNWVCSWLWRLLYLKQAVCVCGTILRGSKVLGPLLVSSSIINKMGHRYFYDRQDNKLLYYWYPIMWM